MKTLLRLAKASAKNVFKMIQSKSPFYCKSLDSEIKITKLFLNHIVNNSKKKRPDYEIIERILIISFLQEIFSEGVITQKRTEEYGETFRISYEKGCDTLCVIVIFSKNKYFLLSCFRKNFEYKKRALS